MKKNAEIIISKKQLLTNLRVIKEKAKNKKICAMVKANAYGHGIENIVKLLEHQVDYFGVANIYEALEIKKINKNLKVLIVGKTKDFLNAINNEISFVIESVAHAKELEKIIIKYNITKCINIHIKINSGMNRLGISSKEELKQIFEICEKYNINVEGVLTHFSTAGSNTKLFENQKEKFEKLLKEIPKRCLPIIHIGGSGVILENVNFPFDMIRVGIALYGYMKKTKVKGVLKIYSSFIKVFEIEKGQCVGYDCGFVAKRKTKIGILPLGYGDGISRRLSGKIQVVVDEKKCNVVGYICMDMMFVDLTGINANEGQRALVFYDAKKWAKILGTTSYEILTNLSLVR